MRRFFFKPEEKAGDYVALTAAESHHIWRVLRLRAGTKVELFDGSGGVYQAELVEVGERVRARILAGTTIPEDDGVAIWVGQGVLKSKNMDMVVQKHTELGVRGLVPLLSSRCQGRLDPAKEGKKHERWLKIIEESCKQCNRTRPMELLKAMDFHELTTFFDSGSAGLKILFWEEERDVSIHDLLPLQDVRVVCLLLGPEGGFTREEVAVARSASWRTVSLGRRILRAETAALASVAILQYLLGAI
jgi:16S rRNA (uracil1498-N3)-methyltransferase